MFTATEAFSYPPLGFLFGCFPLELLFRCFFSGANFSSLVVGASSAGSGSWNNARRWWSYQISKSNRSIPLVLGTLRETTQINTRDHSEWSCFWNKLQGSLKLSSMAIRSQKTEENKPY